MCPKVVMTMKATEGPFDPWTVASVVSCGSGHLRRYRKLFKDTTVDVDVWFSAASTPMALLLLRQPGLLQYLEKANPSQDDQCIAS